MELNKIYNEDCIKGIKNIPSESVDLILTDPPYYISRKSNFKKGGGCTSKYGSISMDFGEWDKGEKIDFELLFKESFRILKKGGTLIMFYDIFKIGELADIALSLSFKQPRIGFWDKTNAVPINAKINYLSNCREYFISFCKGKKGVFNSYYDKGVYSYPIVCGKERTSHPTQKPISLMEELIKTNSNKGDVVAGFFMGSGTTAVAAIRNKRKFIGFELSKEYFDISNERIKQEMSQLKLF